MHTTRVTTAAAELPLTLAEACAQLRMEEGQDDTKILAAVAAATKQIEDDYGVSLVTQEFSTVYDSWPCVFHLTRGPALSVVAIKYKPAGAAEVTLASDQYAVGIKSLPAIVSPAYGKTWPSAALDVVDPVEIVFAAGFGAVTDVPANLKQAVAILTHSLYFDRDGGGADPKTMKAVDHKLRSRRLW